MTRWLKTETETVKRAENTGVKCAKPAENTETTFETATAVARRAANIETKCAKPDANIDKTVGVIAATTKTTEFTHVRPMVAPTVITTAAARTVTTADIIITTDEFIAVTN